MRVFSIAVLMVASLLGGCAVFQRNEAAQQEKWLLQAGFRMVKANTPEKLAKLSKMTPYKIESKVEGDTVVYRYVNPAKGHLYLGGAREFALYQEIAVATKARRSANLTQITPGRMRTTGPLVW